MTVIVADLGATNARLAFIKKGRLSEIYQFACNDFKSPTALIEMFVRIYVPDAKYLLAGVPGTVMNNQVKWTNRSWSLSANALQKKLKFKKVVLMNDLQIQGWALSLLKTKDFLFLQGKNISKGPKILVNIGTGLGSCYIINGEVFSSEYGQSINFQDHTLENQISGPGFKNLYQQITNSALPISAVEIEKRFLKGKREAKEAYQLFYIEFARVLKNLALTIKATGGVYFCGGVLTEKALTAMKLAQNFNKHPKMGALLKNTPLIFIRKKDFAFLGLKRLVQKFGWS